MLAFLVASLITAPTTKELTLHTSDGLNLKGELMMPASPQGKCKAVLMFPGSGPTDRNGNEPPEMKTDILKQIAEALAAQGIASFRFDKRAAHVNAPLFPRDMSKLDDFFAWDRFIDDDERAYDLLRKQPGIDPEHVGLLGHSEGCLQTLVLTGKGVQAPAIFLLGCAGRPVSTVIQQQVHDGVSKQTKDPRIIKSFDDQIRDGFAYFRIHHAAKPGLNPGLAVFFPPGMGKFLVAYDIDPVPLLRRYRGNAIVVQGEKDANVSYSRDFPLVKSALQSRKTGASRFVVVPGASHNLKRFSSPTDPGFAGPVLPPALPEIVNWAKTKL